MARQRIIGGILRRFFQSRAERRPVPVLRGVEELEPRVALSGLAGHGLALRHHGHAHHKVRHRHATHINPPAATNPAPTHTPKPTTTPAPTPVSNVPSQGVYNIAITGTTYSGDTAF